MPLIQIIKNAAGRGGGGGEGGLGQAKTTQLDLALRLPVCILCPKILGWLGTIETGTFYRFS